MEDSFPLPPSPSLAPGTGSAIQTATDPEGVKWQFDDDKGNWVNLNTGEAVSPKVFAQMAGRTGDAARDTLNLAQAMRREEAALTPPTLRPRPAPTMPQPQVPPPVAPVAPTMATGTQGMTAPVMRPQDNPVIPPYSQAQVADLAARRPVPSTRVPVTEGQQQFYRMQQADWLMRNRGMKPVDAMKMVGIGTGTMTPYQQAQIALGQQRLQQAGVPKPMTENQKAMDKYRRESLDFRKTQEEHRLESQKAKLSPFDSARNREIGSRIATIQKQLDALDRPETLTPADQADKERLFMEYSGLLDERTKLAMKYAGEATAASAPVTKPAGSAPTTSSNEVVRMTRDGRKAVYDSKTKQFLRYLTEQPPPEAAFHF